ncbi:MAG: FtsX-like permease family protein [Bacteroidales bacterium]|jgi:putative ABC transport system permease protein|nr:FtsX-like permease family protein [Bacteroidales bacterium]
MIRFLLKGLIRDRSRSLLPLIVVIIGVMMAVFMRGYINGIMVDMIEQTARFNTGHVKVVTKAYAGNMNQAPNDLALIGVSELKEDLQNEFPDMEWVSRIKFGGLIDVPDENGETKSQGPAMGMGLDLLSGNSEEAERLKLEKSLVRGQLPESRGEILLSEDFSRKLELDPGKEVTLIGSTMDGGMAIHNFRVSGTVRFGNTALDRGTIIADIQDVQDALIMDDAAGEILGFFNTGYYEDEIAAPVIRNFEEKFSDENDEYAPVMLRLRDQEGMSIIVDLTGNMATIITIVFMIAMSLVLWNAGLLGGLRRYGEVGIRLAIGEEKGHIYRTMIIESVMIGFAGTIIGTAIGLGLSWLMQTYGLDISEFTKNATTGIMMPNVVRARITPPDFYIGFIPGLLSTVAGTMLAGIGIYKRQTARLFKELET